MSCKEQAGIFRALSDETRFKIIKTLTGGEKCVCELFPKLGLSQPKVSRHLAYLRKSGLVNNRKQGLWQHYSLNMKLIKKFKLDVVLNIKKKGRGKTNEKKVNKKSS